MYFSCRIQQVLISLEIHNWNNCFLLLCAYKRRSWLLKRPPWSIQINMIPIVLTLNNMGWSSGKPVKILKKWLDYLLVGMFIDKVKKFCDHSMILLEMAGDLLTNGHLWKSIDFGRNVCNFSHSVAANEQAESGPQPTAAANWSNIITGKSSLQTTSLYWLCMPHTLNGICVSLFKFHTWILKQF